MWTGLIRRFSTEETRLSGDFGDNDNDHQHHNAASPRSRPALNDGIHDVFTPKPRTVSPFRPPPLDPVVLHGYKDSTPPESRLLTPAVAEEIRTMVPERLRISEDWRLVYSLAQNGTSLATLYQQCRQYEGMRVGFVLVVKDQEGGVSFECCSLGDPEEKMRRRGMTRRESNRTESLTNLDVWRLPLRIPSPGPVLLWQRRVLPVAGLDADVSPAAALGRHDALDAQHDSCSSSTIRHLDASVGGHDARDSLQGVSLQRPQRLLHQLRDGLFERGLWRWPLWPVARRLARRRPQLDLRDVWQRAAERCRAQVQRHWRRAVGDWRQVSSEGRRPNICTPSFRSALPLCMSPLYDAYRKASVDLS